jgi:hypothetical protein
VRLGVRLGKLHSLHRLPPVLGSRVRRSAWQAAFAAFGTAASSDRASRRSAAFCVRCPFGCHLLLGSLRPAHGFANNVLRTCSGFFTGSPMPTVQLQRRAQPQLIYGSLMA